MKDVMYRCPDHGLFKVPMLFGGGWGAAKPAHQCPECYIHDVHTPLRPRGRRRGQEKIMRQIAVSKSTHDRLQEYCKSQNISMSAWVAALVEAL